MKLWQHGKSTVFIGDIHGNIKVLDAILKQFPDSYYVFTGDLFDSFDESLGNQMKCLDVVLNLCRQEKAKWLMGNHDAYYIIPEKCVRGTGYNGVLATLLDPFNEELREVTNLVVYEEKQKLLITHAGVTKPYAKNLLHIMSSYDNENHPIKLMEIVKALEVEVKRDKSRFFHNLGIRSSGIHKVPGPQWCDYSEFVPINGIIQIFGHTPQEKIQVSNTGIGTVYSYCIDCLCSFRAMRRNWNYRPQVLEFTDKINIIDVRLEDG